uniref:DUF1064 domain-containing protein n=1 Tax=viral metagenome TaxID=1070528 RepID=A0A6M3LL82_9ZZZZ
MTKYHNRKVQLDGYTFDSMAEAEHYKDLRLLEQAGEITYLLVHPRFEVMPKVGKERAIVYVADFCYTERDNPNRYIVVDVKGVETAVFRLKANLFRRAYPNHELRIVRKEGR